MIDDMSHKNFDVLLRKFQRAKYNPDLTLRDLPGAPSYADYNLYLQRHQHIEDLKSKYGVVMFTGPDYTFHQYLSDIKELKKKLTLQKTMLYYIVLKKIPVPSRFPKPLLTALADIENAVKFARHDGGFIF